MIFASMAQGNGKPVNTKPETRNFDRNSAKHFLRALCSHCFEEYEQSSFLFITNLISLPYLKSKLRYEVLHQSLVTADCWLVLTQRSGGWGRENWLQKQLQLHNTNSEGPVQTVLCPATLTSISKLSAVSLFQLCLCEHLRNMAVEENAVHTVLLCRVTLPQQTDEQLPNPMSRQTEHPQKQDTHPGSLPARDFPADNEGDSTCRCSGQPQEAKFYLPVCPKKFLKAMCQRSQFICLVLHFPLCKTLKY